MIAQGEPVLPSADFPESGMPPGSLWDWQGDTSRTVGTAHQVQGHKAHPQPTGADREALEQACHRYEAGYLPKTRRRENQQNRHTGGSEQRVRRPAYFALSTKEACENNACPRQQDKDTC